MSREQAAAADTELRVAVSGDLAGNQLDSRPHAPGVLPSAAGTPEPLAEDRAGRDDTPVILLERPRQGSDLAGGAHARRNETREQVRGDCETRPFRNVVHFADQFDAAPRRTGEPVEYVGERLGAALQSRRHEAGCNDGRLQQAEIIPSKVE